MRSKNTRSYLSLREKKTDWKYLLLSVILLVALIKWGIPFFLDIIAGGGGSSKVATTKDTIPPQTPVLAGLPEATNSASIKIEGYTEAEAKVNILNNGNLATEVVADKDGAFGADLKLGEGENFIVVTATDQAGNVSNQSTKSITYDTETLDITTTNPSDNSELFGESNQNIEISGKANKERVKVTVNGAFAKVEKDGLFSARQRLQSGDNKIEIVATDTAGNTKSKTITIKLTL